MTTDRRRRRMASATFVDDVCMFQLITQRRLTLLVRPLLYEAPVHGEQSGAPRVTDYQVYFPHGSVAQKLHVPRARAVLACTCSVLLLLRVPCYFILDYNQYRVKTYEDVPMCLIRS